MSGENLLLIVRPRSEGQVFSFTAKRTDPWNPVHTYVILFVVVLVLYIGACILLCVCGCWCLYKRASRSPTQHQPLIEHDTTPHMDETVRKPLYNGSNSALGEPAVNA